MPRMAVSPGVRRSGRMRAARRNGGCHSRVRSLALIVFILTVGISLRVHEAVVYSSDQAHEADSSPSSRITIQGLLCAPLCGMCPATTTNKENSSSESTVLGAQAGQASLCAITVSVLYFVLQYTYKYCTSPSVARPVGFHTGSRATHPTTGSSGAFVPIRFHYYYCYIYSITVDSFFNFINNFCSTTFYHIVRGSARFLRTKNVVLFILKDAVLVDPLRYPNESPCCMVKHTLRSCRAIVIPPQHKVDPCRSEDPNEIDVYKDVPMELIFSLGLCLLAVWTQRNVPRRCACRQCGPGRCVYGARGETGLCYDCDVAAGQGISCFCECVADPSQGLCTSWKNRPRRCACRECGLGQNDTDASKSTGTGFGNDCDGANAWPTWDMNIVLRKAQWPVRPPLRSRVLNILPCRCECAASKRDRAGHRTSPRSWDRTSRKNADAFFLIRQTGLAFGSSGLPSAWAPGGMENFHLGSSEPPRAKPRRMRRELLARSTRGGPPPRAEPRGEREDPLDPPLPAHAARYEPPAVDRHRLQREEHERAEAARTRVPKRRLTSPLDMPPPMRDAPRPRAPPVREAPRTRSPPPRASPQLVRGEERLGRIRAAWQAPQADEVERVKAPDPSRAGPYGERVQCMCHRCGLRLQDHDDDKRCLNWATHPTAWCDDCRGACLCMCAAGMEEEQPDPLRGLPRDAESGLPRDAPREQAPRREAWRPLDVPSSVPEESPAEHHGLRPDEQQAVEHALRRVGAARDEGRRREVHQQDALGGTVASATAAPAAPPRMPGADARKLPRKYVSKLVETRHGSIDVHDAVMYVIEPPSQEDLPATEIGRHKRYQTDPMAQGYVQLYGRAVIDQYFREQHDFPRHNWRFVMPDRVMSRIDIRQLRTRCQACSNRHVSLFWEEEQLYSGPYRKGLPEDVMRREAAAAAKLDREKRIEQARDRERLDAEELSRQHARRQERQADRKRADEQRAARAAPRSKRSCPSFVDEEAGEILTIVDSEDDQPKKPKPTGTCQCTHCPAGGCHPEHTTTSPPCRRCEPGSQGEECGIDLFGCRVFPLRCEHCKDRPGHVSMCQERREEERLLLERRLPDQRTEPADEAEGRAPVSDVGSTRDRHTAEGRAPVNPRERKYALTELLCAEYDARRQGAKRQVEETNRPRSWSSSPSKRARERPYGTPRVCDAWAELGSKAVHAAQVKLVKQEERGVRTRIRSAKGDAHRAHCAASIVKDRLEE